MIRSASSSSAATRKSFEHTDQTRSVRLGGHGAIHVGISRCRVPWLADEGMSAEKSKSESTVTRCTVEDEAGVVRRPYATATCVQANFRFPRASGLHDYS